MKVLILQLSDIHISSDTDPILGRAGSIVDAVKNLDYEIDLCVCAITGDIAFSGLDDEYVEAWKWLDELSTLLRNRLSWSSEIGEPKLEFVQVPGNHDCDFSNPAAIRDIIIKNFSAKGLGEVDDDLISACIAPQKNYFEYMKALDSDHQEESSSMEDHLLYERVFQKEDESIRFICLNTAWLSSIAEQQGRLLYPESLVSPAKELNAVEVVLMHHPYNWFEAENGRALRNRVESVADIVLTGHEHERDVRLQTRRTGERNTYIEGGVLQASVDPDLSVFNVLLVDTARRKQKILSYSWDGSTYRKDISGNIDENSGDNTWEEFQINKLRTHGQFQIAPKTTAFLEDSGLIQRQSDGSAIPLSEIYVFPDLIQRHLIPKKSPDIVKSSEVVELVREWNHLMITGDDESGKTCLAKMIYSVLYESGKIPTYIDGSVKLLRGENLYGQFDDLFREQYSQNDLDLYQQLDKSAKVAIVDDYHKISSSPLRKQDFLDKLKNHFGQVILLAHDVALAVEDLAHPEIFSGESTTFKFFAISKFGHVRRSELVERWLVVQGREELEPLEYARRRHATLELINNCIGRNFVPSYPVYILAILQGSEAASQVDIRASTHGHFYEILIMNALARGRSGKEYNVTTNYLAFLAFELFKSRETEFNREDLERIHAEYCERHDIDLELDIMIDLFSNCHMLRKTDFGFMFKYKFIYYYFTAAYFRDHLSETDIRDQISKMSRKLHVEEYANIMLFISHLSGDPIVIREMLDAASEIFPDQPVATLEDDVEFLNDLSTEIPAISVEHDDGGIARRTSMEARDAQEGITAETGQEVGRVEDDDSELDFHSKLGASLKTVQILGQVLKNYPGSLLAEEKLRIAKACYDTGRRAMAPVLEALEKDKEYIVQLVLDVLRERYPSLSSEDLKERAKKTVTGMAQLILFYLVRRISVSVGSPELARTYKKLLESEDSTCVRLIDVSICLDQFGNLPTRKIEDLASSLEENKSGLNILRNMVAEHFMLFDDTTYRQKDRVCTALGISLKKALAPSRSRKILTQDRINER